MPFQGADDDQMFNRPPEEAEMVSVCTVIAFVHDDLAGFKPVVYQKCSVVKRSEFKTAAKEILDDGAKAIVNWLPGALEASKNLCPDKGNYKSVEWMCSDNLLISYSGD